MEPWPPWSGRHDRARILILDERGPARLADPPPGPEDPEEAISKVAGPAQTPSPTVQDPELPELPAGDLTGRRLHPGATGSPAVLLGTGVP